jgi:protein involved in polysaccharide export with SLBB domain
LVQIHAVKPGALYWCLLATAIFGLTHASSVCAQTALETQQQTNDRIRAISSRTAAPSHDYIVGRGDLISLEVFDIPELSREVRVSQTGTIGIPLVPVRLYVVGLSELQVQQKVAEVLQANGLVSHPQVMASVREKRSKPITIVGAVAHAMVYQADHPVTLVQVLAEAGGISADAGDTVIVTRSVGVEEANSNEPPEIGPEDAVSATNPAAPNKATTPDQNLAGIDATAGKNPSENPPSATSGPAAAKETNTPNTGSEATPPAIANGDAPPPLANTITVNLAELLESGNTENDIQLQAGDVVTIPHAGIVYALGAVQRPGGFVSANDRGQLSTLKVLALAGGLTRIAKKDHAVIIRKDSMGKQIAIPVDLAKIVQRKSEDVRLMPSDILYIPDSSTKAALIRAGELALAIGTALTIYRLGTGN